MLQSIPMSSPHIFSTMQAPIISQPSSYVTSSMPISSGYPTYPSYPSYPTTYASAPVALPQTSQLDNLPPPAPPAGWVLSGSNVKVEQKVDSLNYAYDYTFEPGTKEVKRLPNAINPPMAPAGWECVKGGHTLEREEKKQVFKYVLNYKPAK